MRAEHAGAVVQLPTACTEAVQQHRRGGRYPKAIGRLGDARAKRDFAESQEEKERREKIKFLRRTWLSAMAWAENIERQLHELGAKPPIDEKPRL